MVIRLEYLSLECLSLRWEDMKHYHHFYSINTFTSHDHNYRGHDHHYRRHDGDHHDHRSLQVEKMDEGSGNWLPAAQPKGTSCELRNLVENHK